MKVKYWVLVFIFYITATLVQEKINIWDFMGLLILVIAFIVTQNKEKTQKEPYIIGNSDKIEYLTSEELETRLKKKESKSIPVKDQSK